MVKKAIDGDTVLLTDGRRVRLIGINAPELAHKASHGRKGNVAEPLALQAQQALARQVDGRRLKLQLGVLAVDHYGRTLGRLFDGAGESIEAGLLREGLGFVVIKAPDFRYRDCVLDAGKQARQRRLGVWRDPYFLPRDAQRVGRADTGFRRVRGVVSVVEVSRKQLFIELRGSVVLKVAAKNVARFDARKMAGLVGTVVEASGWLTYRSVRRAPKKRAFKPYLMQVDDPALIIVAPH